MNRHPRHLNRALALLIAATLLSAAAAAQLAVDKRDALRPGTLPLTWATGGPRCMQMPEWQVHEYNPDLFLLRQSGCTDFEKPFLYVFFGSAAAAVTPRALLFDTGSRNGNLVPTLTRLLHQWLERNHQSHLELIIAHSHSHGDHVAGDAALQALASANPADPAITLRFTAATIEATHALYGIAAWPMDTGSIDLGGRVLTAIPIPGHDTVDVALYDPQTGILLTGDSVYPGRLYIRDLAAYTASIDRLIAFTAGKPVSHLLGNHIEQRRTAFLDYPVGTLYQPDEHELQLPRSTLLEIRDGLAAMHGTPARIAYPDFTLWPVGGAFREADRADQTFRQTQQQQLEHKYDQPPQP